MAHFKQSTLRDPKTCVIKLPLDACAILAALQGRFDFSAGAVVSRVLMGPIAPMMPQAARTGRPKANAPPRPIMRRVGLILASKDRDKLDALAIVAGDRGSALAQLLRQADLSTPEGVAFMAHAFGPSAAIRGLAPWR